MLGRKCKSSATQFSQLNAHLGKVLLPFAVTDDPPDVGPDRLKKWVQFTNEHKIETTHDPVSSSFSTDLCALVVGTQILDVIKKKKLSQEKYNNKKNTPGTLNIIFMPRIMTRLIRDCIMARVLGVGI